VARLSRIVIPGLRRQVHISPLMRQRVQAHREDDAGGTAIAIAEHASTKSEIISCRRNSGLGR
jgi:hypothetical protein